jgi:hypothetical protein
MKKTLLFALLALLVASSAFAFTLSWNPVTLYTDNTTIGSEAQGVFYNVEMDGTTRASRISATSWPIPAVAKKSSHTFMVQTELGALDNTGVPIRSEWSPPFAWTSPTGSPVVPSGISVQP